MPFLLVSEPLQKAAQPPPPLAIPCPRGARTLCRVERRRARRRSRAQYRFGQKLKRRLEALPPDPELVVAPDLNLVAAIVESVAHAVTRTMQAIDEGARELLSRVIATVIQLLF